MKMVTVLESTELEFLSPDWSRNATKSGLNGARQIMLRWFAVPEVSDSSAG